MYKSLTVSCGSVAGPVSTHGRGERLTPFLASEMGEMFGVRQFRSPGFRSWLVRVTSARLYIMYLQYG